MYSNNNLNYTQIKKFIKQLIKNFANKTEFDKVLNEFAKQLNNGAHNDKYNWINDKCFNEIMNQTLGLIADDTLIMKLIRLYAKHLYKSDCSNSDYVAIQLKKDFGKWASK